ncbi:MAG: ATP-dependent helicase HrpB [Planctomycetota bacterium]|nr:ATP-dependent helicase HrpB [Planctomycetota bacterium]
MQPLPVDVHLESITHTVSSHSITAIEAPPGSGKTTRIAPSLLRLNTPNQRIYLVQPRRIAARSVAERIASESNQSVGQQIGYAVRFDQKTSQQTQLVVVTEGILIRKLLQDPTLQETKIVILDEFHERSLDGDLLLGMLRRIQSELRDDLRIVIMSATLDKQWLASALPGAPLIQISTPSFPVKIEYHPPEPRQDIAEHAANVALRVALNRPGDLLIFLAGAGEIQRCCQILRNHRLTDALDVLPLHGSMRIEEQSQAIQIGPRRRIIVATNIAETSLTIPGVQTVIDSGLARVLRFSPDIGLDRLELENISSASATQRAGRAGRVGPGWCIRLWSEVSDRARTAFLDPEIRRVDLCNARLQLHAWGEGDREDFPWIESPRQESWDAAGRLLSQLGAIDRGQITPLGQQMSHIPLHPRLARLCIEAQAYGCLERAVWLAAMLSERDPFDRRGPSKKNSEQNTSGTRQIPTRSANAWQSDCIERARCLQLGQVDRQTPFGWLHAGGFQTIKQSAQQIEQVCKGLFNGSKPTKLDRTECQTSDEGLQRSLLAGFPDRLAKRRAMGKPQGLMVGGKGVQLSPDSGVRDSELFLCVEAQGASGEAFVQQASGVRLEWLQGDTLATRDEMFFHPTQKQVVGRRRTYWLDLCLAETPVAIADEQACADCLFEAVQSHWESVFPKDDPSVMQWIERVGALGQWVPEIGLPQLDLPTLQRAAWEICRGKRSLDQVRAGAWIDWLENLLSPEQRRSLSVEAPERIQVPSGSSIKIEYAAGKPPVLAVKIQEVFSWKQTPRIARGRVPLLLHLLAPSGRPQQITNDLASFWTSGYAEVKKELKRRYPKHSWPDDPWTASPTRR